MKKCQYGFTLIELIITVCIVSITALIAITMYSSIVMKGRRSDATNTLFAMALAEERYRSENTTYGTLAQVWSSVTTSSGGYYTLAISNVSATSYTITATATGKQTSDSESGTSCTNLVLAMSSGTTTTTPAACWPT